MENKIKLRTVREESWERKEYIATIESDLIKDNVKIRLHMWELKKNSSREEEDMKCPISNIKNNRTCTRVLNSIGGLCSNFVECESLIKLS